MSNFDIDLGIFNIENYLKKFHFVLKIHLYTYLFSSLIIELYKIYFQLLILFLLIKYYLSQKKFLLNILE